MQYLNSAYDEVLKTETLHNNPAKLVSFSRKLVAIISFIFILLTSQIIICSTQQISSGELSLLWVKYGRDGKAYATCVIGSTLYVVGYYVNGSSVIGVIESRDINTGELLKSWTYSNASSRLYDCTVMGNYLYVVGGLEYPYIYPTIWSWLILKLTPDLKLVSTRHYNPSIEGGEAFTITTDERYLYVGGYDRSPGNSQWHLIMLEPNNLSILKSYTSNPDNYYDDELYSIGINPLNGKIWLIGVADLYWNRMGRVEVLDQNFALIGVRTIEHAGNLCSQVAFDEFGYAYISCRYEWLKLSPDLKIVKSNWRGEFDKAGKILLHGDHIYFAITEFIDGYYRHVVIRATKDLDVVNKLLSLLIDTDSSFDIIGKFTITGDKLFVAGYDYAKGATSRWVIYSVGIAHAIVSPTAPTPSIITTVVTTLTITSPTTITTTYTTTKTTTSTITSPITIITSSPITVTNTQTIVVTQPVTTTVISTQPPTTYTTTKVVTASLLTAITKTVTSTVPEYTLTITEKPLFSEEITALIIAIIMITTSTAIGVKLKKR